MAKKEVEEDFLVDVLSHLLDYEWSRCTIQRGCTCGHCEEYTCPSCFVFPHKDDCKLIASIKKIQEVIS